MATRAYHHGNLTDALLEETAAHIAKQGAANLSLRSVARKVGVSPSAAYHHFPGRDALLDALAMRELDGLAQSVERFLEDDGRRGPTDRIVALAWAYVQWAWADPGRFELVFGGVREHPGGPTNPRPYLVLERLLDEAVEVGSLTAEARRGAGELLWPAMHGVAALVAGGPLRGRSQRSIMARTKKLIRTILAGLDAPAAA